MPTGTLTKKIHGHENDCVSQPPSTSPNAEPPIAIAAQTPSARARSFPSANVVEMIESAAGEISAPPSPCSAGKPISIPELAARPYSSDAVVKMTSPMRKTRLRPRRSPARPPSKRKPPNTSVYALTIHWRLASESPRSFWIDGSATFTIVASSTTMNCARQTRTRTTHGFTECRDSAAVVTGGSTLGSEETFPDFTNSPDLDEVEAASGLVGSNCDASHSAGRGLRSARRDAGAGVWRRWWRRQSRGADERDRDAADGDTHGTRATCCHCPCDNGACHNRGRTDDDHGDRTRAAGGHRDAARAVDDDGDHGHEYRDRGCSADYDSDHDRRSEARRRRGGRSSCRERRRIGQQHRLGLDRLRDPRRRRPGCRDRLVGAPPTAFDAADFPNTAVTGVRGHVAYGP